MKHYLLMIGLTLCARTASSQYYNPYDNSYANQQAYEYGQRLVREMQAQQDYQDAQSVSGCFCRIGKAISRRNFTNAEEWAKKLYKISESTGYYYLGLVNELMQDEITAEEYYQEGADLGNKNCIAELERINNQGFADDGQIDNVVSYFQQLEVMTYNAAAAITNNIWGDSSSDNSYYNNSPNRSRTTQKANCSICHGTGYDLTPYKYSASADSYHNTAGNKCRFCKSTSDHYHYRCRH